MNNCASCGSTQLMNLESSTGDIIVVCIDCGKRVDSKHEIKHIDNCASCGSTQLMNLESSTGDIIVVCCDCGENNNF